MAVMLFSSALLTIVFFPNLLFCLVDFFVKIWFLKALLRLILPLPVTLNLFLAPDFVFTFGILYSVKLYYYFFPLAATNKYIRFPSNFGICSTLPNSSRAVANFNNRISPLSLYTIDLPAKWT